MHSFIHRLRRFLPILLEEMLKQFIYFSIVCFLFIAFFACVSVVSKIFEIVSAQFGQGAAVAAFVFLAFFVIWLIIAFYSAAAKYKNRYKSND